MRKRDILRAHKALCNQKGTTSQNECSQRLYEASVRQGVYTVVTWRQLLDQMADNAKH